MESMKACLGDAGIITRTSTGSHADATSITSITFASKRFEGYVARLDGDDWTRVEVDRGLTAEELTTLQNALKSICLDVAPNSEPSAMGGGLTTWSVNIDGTKFKVAHHHIGEPPGMWGKLTREEYDLLLGAWPDEK